MFGPSKADIWSQVAADIGGEYNSGGWFKGDALTYQHGEWTLLLDTFTRSSGSGNQSTSTTYTRMRAPFVNKDGLEFKIYRSGLFSSFGKWLGFQDIEIGDPVFDQRYVIKGNPESTVRQLLDDEELRSLFELQPRVNVAIEDSEGWFGPHFPADADQLCFEAVGVMRDPQVVKDLFELFACLLERMVAIDSAYETDPRVTLRS